MWQNRIPHGNIKLRASIISLHWFCFWARAPPSVLQLLSTSVFKNGGYRWLYNWKLTSQSTYWSTSSREFGCLMQIVPLLIVPFAGIVQSCRYLTTGPPDLFDVSVRRPPPIPFIFVILPFPPSPALTMRPHITRRPDSRSALPRPTAALSCIRIRLLASSVRIPPRIPCYDQIRLSSSSLNVVNGQCNTYKVVTLFQRPSTYPSR